MAFISIVEEQDTFLYHPVDPSTGQQTETTLTLRIVPDDQLKILRRKHTQTKWEHGQRVETIEPISYGCDLVDYAIVDWTGVKAKSTGGELPCERKYKLLLPERVQGEVIRRCAGKEGGDEDSAVASKKLSASI